MTRRERRAERQRRYEGARAVRPGVEPDYQASGGSGATRAWDGEAPQPWWLRPLDYKVSGETGALKVPSKVRTWHFSNRANGRAPPARPGMGEVTAHARHRVYEARFPVPMAHHRWRRLRAQQTAASTGTRRRRPGHNWVSGGRRLRTVAFLHKEQRRKEARRM